MPVAYFKCEECGEEHREIVPKDLSSFDYNPVTRKYTFNPAYDGPKVVRVHTCSCGKLLGEKEDPKAVETKFLFNYMCED